MGMKISLERTVTLIRYSILGSLRVREERPDIKTLLEQVERTGIRNDRLLSYLKKIKLLKDGTSLSHEGERVRETGTVSSLERGLYSIWYVEEDPLLGTRPMLMHRCEGGKPANWTHHKKGGEKPSFEVQGPVGIPFNDGNKKINTYEVERFTPEALSAPEQRVELKLTWAVSPMDQASDITIK